MSYKAIIFDMDGTIIDTSCIWEQVTIEFIKTQNIQVTHEMQKKLESELHGLAMPEACRIIKDAFNLTCSIPDMVAIKSRIAMDLYKTGVKFIPGFTDFHSKINELKLFSGVATNADNKTLGLVKDALKLENYFGNHIYNISYVNNVCKPDPAIYIYAARQLGVDPDDCIAIEDSAHGIKAAQRAGIKCIGINTSKNYEQVKRADIIVDAYDDINLHELLNRSIK